MKILTLDIETAPNLGYFWQTRKTTINQEMILLPTYMLCWAAKWLGKKKVIYRNVNDPDFLSKIWELLDEADAVVTYNGISFDRKHLNREFFEKGLPPPTPSFNIDLYRVVSRNFKFPSHTLKYVSRKILKDTKAEHSGIQTWFGCMSDDRKAWREMKGYNIQDVQVTEALYLRSIPWIHNHPNHGLYIENQEDPVCRNCGSEEVVAKGWEASAVCGYQRYRCNACGTPLRGRYAIKGGKAARQILK
jgi:DNA polymerase elongation subunit (family B)